MLQVRILCVPQTSITGCCGTHSTEGFSGYPDQEKQAKDCFSGVPVSGGWSWNYDSNGGSFAGYAHTDSWSRIQSSVISEDGHGWYTAAENRDFLMPWSDFQTVVVCAGA